MDENKRKKMVREINDRSFILQSIETFVSEKFEEVKAQGFSFSEHEFQKTCCEFNIKVISALIGTDLYESEKGIYILKEFQNSSESYRIRIDEIEKCIYNFGFIFHPKEFKGGYVQYEKNIDVDWLRKILESAISKPLGIEDFENIVNMNKILEDRRRKKLRNEKIKKWVLIIGGISLVVIGGAIIFSIFSDKKEKNKNENNENNENNDSDDDININCSFAMMVPENDDIVIFPSDKGDVIISKCPNGDISIDTAGATNLIIDNIGDTTLTILNDGNAEILILDSDSGDTTLINPS